MILQSYSDADAACASPLSGCWRAQCQLASGRLRGPPGWPLDAAHVEAAVDATGIPRPAAVCKQFGVCSAARRRSTRPLGSERVGCVLCTSCAAIVLVRGGRALGLQGCEGHQFVAHMVVSVSDAGYGAWGDTSSGPCPARDKQRWATPGRAGFLCETLTVMKQVWPG